MTDTTPDDRDSSEDDGDWGDDTYGAYSDEPEGDPPDQSPPPPARSPEEEALAHALRDGGDNGRERGDAELDMSIARTQTMSDREFDALLARVDAGEAFDAAGFEDLDQAEAISEAQRRVDAGETYDEILRTDEGGDERSEEDADRLSEFTAYWRQLHEQAEVERASAQLGRQQDALAETPIDWDAVPPDQFDTLFDMALAGEDPRVEGRAYDPMHVNARLARLEQEAGR